MTAMKWTPIPMGMWSLCWNSWRKPRRSAPTLLVLIEQRLDFSCYVPDGFGTGDCLIVADKLLHIIDFKYGQGVLVDAEENPQMMLYALGALRQFDHLYEHYPG